MPKSKPPRAATRPAREGVMARLKLVAIESGIAKILEDLASMRLEIQRLRRALGHRDERLAPGPESRYVIDNLASRRGWIRKELGLEK